MSDETTPAVAEATPTTADEVGQLPEWTQKLIKELRSENAKHRKAKTQAEKAEEAAKQAALAEQGKYKELNERLQAQLDEALASKEAAELAGLKAQVASKLGLPQMLVDRLQGTTAEELEADGQALLDAMPQPQTPTGTDAGKGTNSGGAPTPAVTEQEVREFAAIYGLNYETAKQQLMQQ
jgi:ribosomal protein L13E